MIRLSPKLKVLVVVATLVVLALVGAVVGVVVSQKLSVVKVKSLSFSNASANLMVGDSTTLSVVIDPLNAKNKKVTFSSSDSSVVSISSKNATSVTIVAKKIGEADILVTSDSNKKLTDKCHIVVSDNIAHQISFSKEGEVVEKISVESNSKVSVSIDVSPSGANMQKIKVSSYDSKMISSPSIVLDGSKSTATLQFKAISAGTSQIVVGSYAEIDGNEKLIISKAIMVEVVSPQNRQLFYRVHSSNFENDATPSFDMPVLLVDGGYYVSLSFFEGEVNKNNTGGATAVETTILGGGNPNLDISKNSNGSYIIKSKNNNWTNEAVGFYTNDGLSVSVKFAKVSFSNLNGLGLNIFNVEKNDQGKYELVEGNSYLIRFSDKFMELLNLGVFTLSFSKSQNIDILVADDLILTCNQICDNLHLTVIANPNYWDTTFADRLSGLQDSIVISVSAHGFDE